MRQYQSKEEGVWSEILPVALTEEHPFDAGTLYVTVYDPAVLLDGKIAPVFISKLNPAVEEYVPPVAPVKVGFWAVVTLVQNGSLYEMFALSEFVIVTDVVVLIPEHPALAAIV